MNKYPIVPLGEVCDFVYGDGLKETDRKGGNIPVYGSNGIVGWHDEAITKGETLIVGRKGSIGEVHFSKIPCWAIDTTYYVDKTKVPCDFTWLYYTLKALDLTRLNKSAAVPGLNREDAYEQKIPLPPLTEQKRIASLLARADRLRSLRRTARELGDSLLQSVFLEMFGHVKANDKKWELAKFEDVCESRLGKMLDDKKQTGKHKRQYLRNFNVQWFRFDLSDIAEMDFDEKDRKEFRLQYGDILMCEGGEVGRCAIWKNKIEECYFQKALHRIRPNADMVKSEYLVHLFWWLAQTGGLGDFTSQVTIAHLTGEKLKELVIPVPPLNLQEEFASVVARVEQMRARQAEGERQAEGLFESLLALSFVEGLALNLERAKGN